MDLDCPILRMLGGTVFSVGLSQAPHLHM